MLKEIDFKTVFQRNPGIAVLLQPNSPDFTIVEITNHLLLISQKTREVLIGQRLFDVFPDKPEDNETSGEANLRSSLEEVIKTKKSHSMPLQRYDVPDRNGKYQECYWQLCNEPILNDNGTIDYILNNSENVTDNVLAKKLAATTSNNFEYFLSQASAPFSIMKGRDFVFTFVNNAYHKLMNRRTLVGKTVKEAIPELEGQPFILYLENVFDTGVPFHAPEVPATAIFEGDVKPSTRYFNLSYTPYKNLDGDIEGILASGYDVTEKVELTRKEKRQLENRQAYTLFKQAPAAICVLDGPDYIYELVNKPYQDLFPNHALLGKPLLAVFPELKDQPIIEILHEVYATGKTYEGSELKVSFASEKGGLPEDHYFNFIYQARHDETSNIDGILVFGFEVTGMVLTKIQLEISENKFRNMLETIPQITWTSTRDGLVDFFNQRWYTYTGLSVEQSLGTQWASVVHPEDNSIIDKYTSIINSREQGEYELRVRNAYGVYRWHLVRHVPVIDHKGNIELWVGTGTDIHDLKMGQEQKDEFISIASHELKTPITTLKASFDLLDSFKNSGLPTDLSKELLTHCKRSVNRITLLIDELLDASKYNHGQVKMNKRQCVLSKLINDCCQHVRVEGKYNLKTQGDMNLEVNVDENRIEQVLMNFVNNSIKYAPESVDIVLNIEKLKDMAKVSVTDKGKGISKEVIPHLFERYYRANNERSNSGLGLGLYICSEIIKKHDGQIGVISEIDKGSTFWFTLPLNDEDKT